MNTGERGYKLFTKHEVDCQLPKKSSDFGFHSWMNLGGAESQPCFTWQRPFREGRDQLQAVDLGSYESGQE